MCAVWGVTSVGPLFKLLGVGFAILGVLAFWTRV